MARGHWVPLWEVMGCAQVKGRSELRALHLLCASTIPTQHAATCGHYYCPARRLRLSCIICT